MGSGFLAGIVAGADLIEPTERTPQVSKLCKEIDERVNAVLERPLEGEWPYVWLDATYLKVRDGGRIVSVAAIVAVAVDTDGRREIIGLGIGPFAAWQGFYNHHRPHSALGPGTPSERIAELAPAIPTPEAVRAAYDPSREFIRSQNTRCRWLPAKARVT